MRVLVFGDSITQGYWDIEGGWVDRIRKRYDAIQVKDLEERDEPTIFNLGISADTSEDTLGRIENETKVRTRHDISPVLIVQIGIHDSSLEEGNERVPSNQYRKNIEMLAQTAKNLTSKLLLIGLSACNEKRTTPVFWDEIYYTNEQIQKYEGIMQDVAEQYAVPFIPIFDLFKAALDQGQELLADGLHPNSAGHQFIADIVKPNLQELLV